MKASRTRGLRSAWILSLALCFLSPVAMAQGEPTVLGQDGTVFRLYQGPYGDLFSDGRGADPASPVLALEVRSGDGSSELLLVPGTETADRESSASMVFEDTTGVVYLVWETMFNGLHPLLQLTSFDGTAWSELIEITGNIFASKGAPRLVVRRETDEILEDGLDRVLNRTTLHLTWWEESVDVSLKRHALIILSQGRYLGWAPILGLNHYVLESDASQPPAVPGLENTLGLQAGRGHRSVVSGFVNPTTHRLITLEIQALSQILGNFAEKVRAGIAVIGLEVTTFGELADVARSEVERHGTAFHEAARQYLADQAAAIVEETPEDLTSAGILQAADAVRAGIAVIGSRFDVGGLIDPRPSELIQVGQSPAGGGPYNYYQITVVSDRPAPEVGGPAQLFLSESGESVIVTWEEGESVLYRESSGEGWSDPTSIALTQDLDRAVVYQMLAERVRAE